MRIHTMVLVLLSTHQEFKICVKRERGTGHHGLDKDVHFTKPVIARAARQADGSADASFGCGTVLPEPPS